MYNNYFMSKPNEYQLISEYNSYVTIMGAVREMVYDQRVALDEATDKLYEIFWMLRNFIEQAEAGLENV